MTCAPNATLPAVCRMCAKRNSPGTYVADETHSQTAGWTLDRVDANCYAWRCPDCEA